tara:strand:- start:1731 stop:2750 length:1020 start_codon:yes stop_codon:yes gene_type:complete
MKLLILGDLHFGQAKSEKWTEDNQKLLMDDVLDYCKLNAITRIIQPGDFFDNRKALKHTTLNFVREDIVDKFNDLGIQWDVVVGNHDMFYKTTVQPNACDEVLGHYKTFTIHNKPTTIDVDGLKIDMIPWICEDNQEEVMSFIAESTSTVCFGHFELSGFKYNQSIPSNGGSSNFLEGYRKVISGHFHTRSDNGTVFYIGTPFQLDFNDADDPRGFTVFDTDTLNMEFVDSGYRHYTKVKYSEVKDKDIDFTNMRVRLYTDCEDDNFKLFASEIAEIADRLDIVYNTDVAIDWADGEEEIDLEDTRSLVLNTIDGLEITKADKKFITKAYDDLYIKASE